MAYVQHYCGPISAKMLRTLSLIVFVVLVMKIELIASSNVSTEAIQNSTQTTTIAPAVRAATLNVTKKSKQDEVDILPPHYYRDVAPMTKDRKPVKVTVSLVILNIKLSQGSSQTFDADMFYHNYWTDHRLQKPSNEDAIAQRINLSAQESLPQYKLSDSWRKRIWTPDTYFRNAIEGGVSNILTPTHYFTITNYTEVFMAVRLSLKLSCEMNFVKFPFDVQKCFINISMTSEDINTVILEWDMFRVGSHVDRTEFQVISVDKQSCAKYLDIGIFSCLYGEIIFKRNIGNYLIKRFIPSFFIVLMSFCGFWIPTTVSPARTSIPITALLALITQQIQSDLNVSYVYALQIWNIVSIIFVFCALLEFAIALYAIHMNVKRKGKKKKCDDVMNNVHHKSDKNRPLALNIDDVSKGNSHELSKWHKAWRRLKSAIYNHFRSTTRHSFVDHVSRYLFPLSYFLFILVFVLYCFYW